MRATAAARSIVADAQKSGNGATILLVEDEAFVREVAGEILRTEGYRVLTAANACTAMRVFRDGAGRFDVLITDVVLPGRNGLDLAQEMTALCPGLKTICISGYPQHAVKQENDCSTSMLYLPKPFSLESLLHKVRRALGTSAIDAREASVRPTTYSG